MINYLFQEQNWQSQLNDLITDPIELLNELNLSTDDLTHDNLLAQKQFKLRVPRQFVKKMERGNPLDPLFLQVFPHHLELQEEVGFTLDPLGEKEAKALPGLLHKYPSRVLLTLTGACGIHCRYCFRRHFPYGENAPRDKDWPAMRDYIIAHPEINEIILSGGDPLSLSNEKLQKWVEHFSTLEQIKVLRIHTRMPVVIPERIDQNLINIIKNTHLKTIFVIHSNHKQELDHNFDLAMQKLINHNVIVLNQSVLLKGINDNANTLAELSGRLFDANVLPYYLHVLDKVSGAAHFLITDQTARIIYQGLLKQLPGYLVPKLVREISGECHKTPLNIYVN